MDPSNVNATTATSAASEEEALQLMDSNLLKLLDSCIKSARDLLSPGVLGALVRDSISTGSLPGPRLQVAHSPLIVPGSHAHAMGGICSGIAGV